VDRRRRRKSLEKFGEKKTIDFVKFSYGRKKDLGRTYFDFAEVGAVEHNELVGEHEKKPKNGTHDELQYHGE
jgi:hypothetical protein